MHVMYKTPGIICFQNGHFVYQPILYIYACTGVYYIYVAETCDGIYLALYNNEECKHGNFQLLFVIHYPSNKESISLTVSGKICLT